MTRERKRALVTGGAHRVGREIALALARDGMRVAIHYHASREEADHTLDQLRSLGAEPVAIAGDLRRSGEPERVVTEAASAMGGLDLLVNSAAMMQRTPVGEVSVEQWDDMFALNLRAPFFASQAAAAVLADGGCIVNIADLAAFEAWPDFVPHGISKAGVIQMTRSLAKVLAPRVRVNAVAPGAVLMPPGTSEEVMERFRKTTPLGRIGSPSDVAEAVIYLAHAGYVTGETIIVDGGRHVRR